MHTYLMLLKEKRDLTIQQYQEESAKLANKIKGIAEFRIQRLTVFAVCSSVIVTNNVHYATYGFPSSNSGASKKAAASIENDFEKEYRTILKDANVKLNFKLKGNPEKLAKMLCHFLFIETNTEWRYAWCEYLLCEAIGRKNFIMDYIFYEQNLYYVFKEGNAYYVKVKPWNKNHWITLAEYVA